MKTWSVVVSAEAALDLERGRDFYQRQAEGLGDYFLSCLLSDLESLTFFAGIHAVR